MDKCRSLQHTVYVRRCGQRAPPEHNAEVLQPRNWATFLTAEQFDSGIYTDNAQLVVDNQSNQGAYRPAGPPKHMHIEVTLS